MTSPGGTDPKPRGGESDVRPATRPRVLLADDYANILTAMVRLISSSCDVVGTVTTGAQLLDADTPIFENTLLSIHVTDGGFRSGNPGKARHKVMRHTSLPSRERCSSRYHY